MSLYKEKHIQYVVSLDTHVKDYQYWLSEHLRLNGTYWGLTALCLLKSKDSFKKEEIVAFVMSCRNEDGGFGAYKNHDSHLLSTCSALQILLIYDSLDALLPQDVDKTVRFITSMQLSNGSFQGDRFGEIDTRFSYTALQSLAILERLTEPVVDKAADFILLCANFDGGFGLAPGAESHAAQVFTCLAALAIAGKLDAVDKELIAWWLSERQVENGGLNGRPGKLPDVCYSWWVLSSLAIIDRLNFIDFEKLREFILSCQDEESGGISDRPGNQVDVFHTIFGLAGLSLMGYEDLELVDPTYCLPVGVSKKIRKWPYRD